MLKEIWDGMKTPTRIVLIVGIVVTFTTVTMALIYTGQLSIVLDWIKK